MKVTYAIPSGHLSFEFDAPTTKDAFEALASLQDVFGDEACGCCGSKAIKCEVRTFDGNRYFKMLCECGATLEFGQYKDAAKGLFVKRFKGDTREPLPHRGWGVYKTDRLDAGPHPPTLVPSPARPAPVPATNGNGAAWVPPNVKPAVLAKATPSNPARPTPAQPVQGQFSIDDKFAQVLTAFSKATTRHNCDAWGRWARNVAFSEEQKARLDDAYHEALERIEGATVLP